MNSISYLLLLCGVAALTSGQVLQWKTPMALVPNNSSSGGNKITGQIIAGSPATLGMFPWQAALLLTKATGTFICGGSLIHPQWVVSAAHCTIGSTSIVVRLGTLIYNSGTSITVNTAASIITHPSYNSANLNNDIGLIKLPSALALSSTVNTIKIAPTSLVFSALTVSGWGKTCNTCPTSNTLNYAVVNAIANSDCSAVYGTSVVTTNTLCTKGSPSQSPCQGDSGGPLIQTGSTPYLVGVVSFVSSAGCLNNYGHPAGYIRIANYCSWLNGYIPSICGVITTTKGYTRSTFRTAIP